MSPVDEGTPQGGPLSPLLSNIVLDEFDRELERRGLRFARYADDSNIYVRSRRAGERVMASITRFITTKLKLKVNEQKSAVARPWERKFLGFSFTANREPKRRIAPKAVLRFKEKVRELTRRTRGVSMEQMAEELGRYLRGWIGYFGKCQTPSVLQGLEEWIQAQAAVCDLEAVETGHGAIRGTAQTGSGQRSRRENGGQRSWTVAAGEQPGTCICAAQCLLRLARDSEIDCRPIAQPAEPPDADPHVRWCGRGEAARLPPIPICASRIRSSAHQSASARHSPCTSGCPARI